MKQWLPQGNGEHELTRKGIDNVTYIVIYTTVKTESGPTIYSEYYFTYTHVIKYYRLY